MTQSSQNEFAENRAGKVVANFRKNCKIIFKTSQKQAENRNHSKQNSKYMFNQAEASLGRLKEQMLSGFEKKQSKKKTQNSSFLLK